MQHLYTSIVLPFPLKTPVLSKLFKLKANIRNISIVKDYLIGLKNKSAQEYIYIPSPAQSAHVVKQHLEYIPRNNESKTVCKHMLDRYTIRSVDMIGTDKSVNPLIEIPGSPGSGKSTFLTQFPVSDAYTNYLKQTGNRSNPIVSILSFNSGMDGGETVFGLRMIYGAMISMGLTTKDKTGWLGFHDKFISSCGALEARKALDILLDVFGMDRPFLLLIDELSKANKKGKPEEDENVMEQISPILTHYTQADVIVSALSPNYVETLRSAIGREIIYCIMGPLLDAKLGINEAKKWTDQIIEDLKKSKKKVQKMSKIEKYFLEQSFILFSGHARSLENMADAYKKNVKQISEIFKKSKKDRDGKPRTFKILLEEYLDTMGAMGYDPSTLSVSAIEDFVFKPSVRVYADADPPFRNILENGKVFLYQQVDNKVSIPAMKAIWILQMIRDKTSSFWTSNSPKMIAARQLFSNLPLDISDWWERLIDITIVCRSYDQPSSSIGKMFGISNKGLSISEDWNLTVCRELNNTIFNYPTLLIEKTNALIVPLPGNSGFNSLVMLHPKKMPIKILVYIQAKIKNPNKEFKKSIADMICYNMLHYFTVICNSDVEKVSLENVHMIVYNWGILKDKKFSSDMKENCNKLISDKFDDIKDFSGGKNEVLRNIVNEFLEKYLFSNVHVVGRGVLEDWILPSFTPFPIFFAELGVDDGK